jgi:hypothetical protein
LLSVSSLFVPDGLEKSLKDNQPRLGDGLSPGNVEFGDDMVLAEKLAKGLETLLPFCDFFALDLLYDAFNGGVLGHIVVLDSCDTHMKGVGTGGERVIDDSLFRAVSSNPVKIRRLAFFVTFDLAF